MVSVQWMTIFINSNLLVLFYVLAQEESKCILTMIKSVTNMIGGSAGLLNIILRTATSNFDEVSFALLLALAGRCS